MYNRYDAIE